MEQSINWADDGTNSNINQEYRKALGTKPNNNTVLKTTKTKPKKIKVPDLNSVEPTPEEQEEVNNLF